MSLVQGAETQLLEFLSSCEARLETSWNAVYGNLKSSLVINFCKGQVDGAGTDPTGQFAWTGDLKYTGECRLVKQYKGKHQVIHEGTYNSEDNAITGKWHVPGTKASGTFVFTLSVPDIQVASVEAEIEMKADAGTKQAVKTYKKQREKLLRTPLGSAQEETLTYWTALYVYGSGRSDTVKDILIKVNGGRLYGEGKDEVGDYIWDGVFEDSKRVVLSKKYAGKHEIRHTGNYTPDANVIKGAWTIPGTRACGGFQLSEHVASRALTSTKVLDVLKNANRPQSALDGGDGNGAAAPPEIDGPLDSDLAADTTWGALYVYGSGRNDKLKDCVLTFDHGKISGTGEDDLAKFVWDGRIEPNGKVVLHKKYVGKHEIVHKGEYIAADKTIRGEFNVPGTRAIGVFHLTEKPALRRRTNKNRACPVSQLTEKAVCEFVGEYEYKSGRSDEITGIILTIDGPGGSVDGAGKDNVGSFSWFGKVSTVDKSVKLVKQYAGKHAVTHVGVVDEETGELSGTWSIAGTKANGKFTLREKLDARKLPNSTSSSGEGKKRRRRRGDTNTSTTSGAAAGDDAAAAAIKVQPLAVQLAQTKADVHSTWKGWCEMGKRRDEMNAFTLIFHTSGKVTGSGSDAVGEFDWTGTYTSATNACTLTKQYKGMHSMDFNGVYEHGKNQIIGTWVMPGTRAKGAFELSEVTSKRKQ
eukprot:TRINITY_DN36529_c0_g1_i1.p1 TRINITY_DN36529_c0_g1~~TRINITY_DN36529_c0_g1_i1.p1  ORF type:complete len:696 (+),score=179.72 TRINITY_DN36529_c0_g1_i1:63-2150(+)